MAANRRSPKLLPETEAEILRLAAKRDGTAIELAQFLAGLGKDNAAKTIERIAESKPEYRRRLFYLLKIWRTLGHLDTQERLTAIGWKKLKIIAQHVEEKNVEGRKRDALASRALRLAEKHTVAELPSILDGKGFEGKPHRIELLLDARQYKIFENVLRNNGAKEPEKGRGLSGKEAALTRALSKLGRTPMRSRNRPQTSVRSSQSA